MRPSISNQKGAYLCSSCVPWSVRADYSTKTQRYFHVFNWERLSTEGVFFSKERKIDVCEYVEAPPPLSRIEWRQAKRRWTKCTKLFKWPLHTRPQDVLLSYAAKCSTLCCLWGPTKLHGALQWAIHVTVCLCAAYGESSYKSDSSRYVYNYRVEMHPYCITVLQYDCITGWLYYCIIVLLYYCIIALLYYCITVFLYYSIIVLLCYCIAALL